MDCNPTLDDTTGSKNIVQKGTLVTWGKNWDRWQPKSKSPSRCRDFVAIGYTQRYLCHQPHPRVAIPGGIAVIAWVDATNIKINPSKNPLLVGLANHRPLPVAVIGVHVLLRNPVSHNTLTSVEEYIQ